MFVRRFFIDILRIFREWQRFSLMLLISYGSAGVHDEGSEQLHANDRVDEEQDHHQHTNVRQGLNVNIYENNARPHKLSLTHRDLYIW